MKRILLIDDDEDIVMVTKFILESAGFKVETGGSAEEGLAYLEKNIKTLPDLLLLDLFLPKMQGWELSKKLKSEKQFKNIPIVIFTANAGITKKTVDEMCGDDFVIKPYEETELLAIVKKSMDAAVELKLNNVN